MRFAPTPNGGRMALGDTPYGAYTLEAAESFADAQIIVNGRVVGRASMEIRTPDTIAKPGTALANTLARAGFHKCPACHKRAKWLDRQWYKIACAWRCLTR